VKRIAWILGVVASALLGDAAWAKGGAAPPPKPPVKPAALAWVTGTVTDEAGKPIAGAEALVAQVEPKGAWRATTDAKGTFTVKGVPQGEASVVLRAKSRIPVETKVQVPAKGLVAADAVLRLGVRFAGKVTDMRGAPIAGARVEPTLVDEKGNAVATNVPAFLRGSFVSGADGSFVVDGLAPGNRYTLVLSHPHFKDSLQPGLAAAAGGGHDALDPVMEDAAWISGVVVDADGKPVAGAQVGGPAGEVDEETVASLEEMLRELFKEFEGGPIVTSGAPPPATPGNVTDAQGRFEIGGLLVEEYDVTVTADGYFPATVKVEELVAGQAKSDVRIAIEKATAWVAGQVVDAAGKPVANATVTAHGDVKNAGEAKTDAQGAFRMSRVKSHVPVELRAKAAGYADASVKDVALNAPGAKVVLLLAPRLKVKVVDGDGKVIPKVTVIEVGKGRTIRFEGGAITISGGGGKRKEWDQGENGLEIPLPTGEVEIKVTAKDLPEKSVGKWTAEAGKVIDGGVVTLEP
jgi:protocatechuate 3,4-dioxygenase beta subunit